MPQNLDESDFLEKWSQGIKDTDVQYSKALSSIKPLIAFDNAISNDANDVCDADVCVAVYRKKIELTTTKQKLQQEHDRLSQDIETYNRKIKVLQETLESCKDKCLQESSQNKTYKNLLKTAIKKYEKNLDFVITVENKTDTSYEATFKFKPGKKEMLKVLIDRTKGEILDYTVLHELPNDGDMKDITNLLYLCHKSIQELKDC
ncbi:unnamed protein product [Callosobruchus maculatus]|uniref:Kinetochore protein SPC25 n=1 Tax=Callosobruchus maculatus TaxID=64391 RepID=A0A653D6M4_CALMS|nr:unnamed protein product [Callosobruchus maculatus]